MSKSLQQKNTRSLLTWLPLVMLVGSIGFYLVLRSHIYHLQEQQLELKQENTWNTLRSVPGGIPLHIKCEYDIEKGTPAPRQLIGRQRDTSIYYPSVGHWDAFAVLTEQYKLGDTTYQITTYFSSKEITHLLIKLSIAEAVIFLLLLGAIVIINRRTSRTLWTPFYDTMDAIRRYDIQRNKPLVLTGRTGVDEFDRLNLTLTSLIDDVNRAYNNQKQFTENASHELQTPLAIIRSKVELLMDAPFLTEEIATQLGDINDANERLSQMNKNLFLLTRIDNHQFPELHRIPISHLLERSIIHYQEYYSGELPAIKTCIETGVHLQANSSLIEVLINNLLRNAIIHNVPGGYVHVRLTGKELWIENSGPILNVDPQRLFERFRKGREESRTTGLGLALVKQICHLYQFEVQYLHEEGIHRIQVIFSSE
ncbi:MAG TPA: HAMP domain-containing sensor histidine kinase [Puia sp.]|jgi:signal transduction histidine kinase|nr:HAMP domain-containing sensor histidine kinase [Puia sp.]